MTRRVLLDTGVLVAVANRADADHVRCWEAWKTLDREPVSVEGTLVEATHLLRRTPKYQRDVLELARAIETRFVPLTDARLRRALALMERYHDVPMDFVDALLVAVADEEQITDVLTLDRRGFLTYRLKGGRRFRLLPE